MSDSELLSLAISAVLKAGKAILSVYHGDIAVTLKEDASPLTKADLDAHDQLLVHLSTSGLPVLSEEASDIPYDIRKDWQRYWLIDPLDGTREFIHRNGEFTVNVALIENGLPLAGVIYAPVTDELYAGCLGLGAWYASDAASLRSIALKELNPLSADGFRVHGEEYRYTVAVSRSHLDAETTRYIDQLKQTKGDIQVLPAGSSMKLCLVAAGKADEYPRFGPTCEWDIAAGHAILRAVGKDVISLQDGLTLCYNKPDLKNAGFIAR